MIKPGSTAEMEWNGLEGQPNPLVNAAAGQAQIVAISGGKLAADDIHSDTDARTASRRSSAVPKFGIASE